jgi:hypothetical protein
MPKLKQLVRFCTSRRSVEALIVPMVSKAETLMQTIRRGLGFHKSAPLNIAFSSGKSDSEEEDEDQANSDTAAGDDCDDAIAVRSGDKQSDSGSDSDTGSGGSHSTEAVEGGMPAEDVIANLVESETNLVEFLNDPYIGEVVVEERKGVEVKVVQFQVVEHMQPGNTARAGCRTTAGSNDGRTRKAPKQKLHPLVG